MHSEYTVGSVIGIYMYKRLYHRYDTVNSEWRRPDVCVCVTDGADLLRYDAGC